MKENFDIAIVIKQASFARGMYIIPTAPELMHGGRDCSYC